MAGIHILDHHSPQAIGSRLILAEEIQVVLDFVVEQRRRSWTVEVLKSVTRLKMLKASCDLRASSSDVSVLRTGLAWRICPFSRRSATVTAEFAFGQAV